MWPFNFLKIQTPGNYPEENIQHSQHGESLKSRTLLSYNQQSPFGEADRFSAN
jgi:hypothetical protein